MTAADDTVLLEAESGITTVTLNRPGRRNGMTVDLCQRLNAKLGEIAASDARVVILRGAGDDFSVGADIDAPGVERAGRSLLEVTGSAFESAVLLHKLPQVTIAAIDGACAGGALGWAAACDFRWASTRAKFATAFLKIGGSGDMGLAWSLARIVGAARVREMLLFPEKFGAGQALEWGLVTRIHEPAALFDATLAAARQVAAAPAFALRMMKANLLSAEMLPFDAYVEIETARMMAVSEGGSLREGFAAFRAARAGAGPQG